MSTEPTVMTNGSVAGLTRAPPLLPAETTTMPLRHADSTAWVKGLEVYSCVESVP